ncbi:riboflavin biosynthesis protein RibF [Isobaculum melis]|uniref:Riboflavin biosynthesis protein n=1 Tax=Isobaculum melis TaxID=142588 RepID=A0A1H9RTT9_9LACT|nr:riboflavin biosynthesis protein RibF [Isobaculum melis]SER76126.1 riboflavin kinase / FMN adenylyltransferase [Isobaculum melis]
MEIIHIHHPYEATRIPADKVVLVLGFFDGVHKGHQALIEKAKELSKEKNLKVAVMTFDPHPSVVFQKIDPEKMKYLSTLSIKEDLMAALGVEILYEVQFTSSFAKLTPEEFVEDYIIGLNAEHIVAGFDYTYGPKDIANMERLPGYAKGRFGISMIEKQTLNDEKISSTRIRLALDAGHLEEANRLLGYEYTMRGRVVHGDARGRTLGFPTANIQIEQGVHVPRIGVYAVKILVNRTWHHGMASIGYNVTFEADRPMTVEVYILDFDEDIYGEPVSVAWCHYLRDEIKFSGIEPLITQLKQDEVDTRAFFKK